MSSFTTDFEELVRHYLVNSSSVRTTLQTRNVTPELEIRFGTNPKQARPITSVDYQNIVKTLSWNGWTTRNLSGVQMLRIIPNTIVKDGHYNNNKGVKPDEENGDII